MSARKAAQHGKNRVGAAGDAADYAAMFHEDLVWTIIGSTAVSGRYESRDALFARMAEVLGDVMEGPLLPELVDMIAEGDRVSVRLVSSAMAKNGVAYDQHNCWALRLEDGKIVEGTAYMDTGLVDAVLDSARAAVVGGGEKKPEPR